MLTPSWLEHGRQRRRQAVALLEACLDELAREKQARSVISYLKEHRHIALDGSLGTMESENQHLYGVRMDSFSLRLVGSGASDMARIISRRESGAQVPGCGARRSERRRGEREQKLSYYEGGSGKVVKSSGSVPRIRRTRGRWPGNNMPSARHGDYGGESEVKVKVSCDTMRRLWGGEKDSDACLEVDFHVSSVQHSPCVTIVLQRELDLVFVAATLVGRGRHRKRRARSCFPRSSTIARPYLISGLGDVVDALEDAVPGRAIASSCSGLRLGRHIRDDGSHPWPAGRRRHGAVHRFGGLRHHGCGARGA